MEIGSGCSWLRNVLSAIAFNSIRQRYQQKWCHYEHVVTVPLKSPDMWPTPTAVNQCIRVCSTANADSMVTRSFDLVSCHRFRCLPCSLCLTCALWYKV
jgi:hypothetical protein